MRRRSAADVIDAAACLVKKAGGSLDFLVLACCSDGTIRLNSCVRIRRPVEGRRPLLRESHKNLGAVLDGNLKSGFESH